jgi:hypothetical protein
MTKVNKHNNNSEQEYIPTPNEMRILEVMIDPSHLDKTVIEKCEILGISRTTYYWHMNKPEFQAYYIGLAKELIKQNAVPLVNAAVKFAKAGSFQHFKYLMEMGEIHKEDNKLQLEGAIEHIVTFGRSLDDDPDELPDGRVIIDVEPEDPEDL